MYLAGYALEEGESLGELQGRFPDSEPASALVYTPFPLEGKPSWGLVSSADRTVNPAVERFGYQRAGMTTVEVDSSHLVMLAQPKPVADLIRAAVRSVTN
ncbi:hypothetical protein GCM10010519_10930 [Streptomyces lactacystinicus]